MKRRLCAVLLTVMLAVLSVYGAGCSHRALGEDPSETAEAAAIAAALGLRPGDVIADVGAGKGAWAVELGRLVAPGGRIYATEVKEDLVEEIRERLEDESPVAHQVVLGDDIQTGLPADCCDAILLRRVYHHFVEPQAMNADLLAALRPGGKLAIVDYSDFLDSRVQGVPENRTGHGLASSILLQELAEAGFELVSLTEPWMEKENMYCAVFQKPTVAPADGSETASSEGGGAANPST